MMTLDSAAYPRLIELLGDSPQTVIPLHFLLRKECEVFVDDPDALRNVVIRTEMVFVYGEDRRELIPLIAAAGPARLMWTPEVIAPMVKAAAEEALGTPLQQAHVEQKSASLALAPPGAPGYEVRRMMPEDVGVLGDAPEEIQWTRQAWGPWERITAEGIVAGALHEGKVVALATTFGRSQGHDDLGVATAREHQGKGLCTACAATLMAAILGEGRTPVWTVDVANKASFRVSEKLGFVTRFHAAALSEASKD